LAEKKYQHQMIAGKARKEPCKAEKKRREKLQILMKEKGQSFK
jgi:hypothetical protein